MSETLDLTSFIRQDGSGLITDSRAVAVAFGKQHKNVMRVIDGMLKSSHAVIAEHGRLNFEPSSYINAQGKSQPMYRMTQDGLSELAMSFSGDMARVVRIRFIAAFREVANRLEASERSITALLHDHDKRAAVSEAKGRIGSQLMNARRKEKPALADECARLKEASQPSLELVA